jgi:hypothetical protein
MLSIRLWYGILSSFLLPQCYQQSFGSLFAAFALPFFVNVAFVSAMESARAIQEKNSKYNRNYSCRTEELPY